MNDSNIVIVKFGRETRFMFGQLYNIITIGTKISITERYLAHCV